MADEIKIVGKIKTDAGDEIVNLRVELSLRDLFAHEEGIRVHRLGLQRVRRTHQMWAH